ncbi:hypothetical protein [Campylobacter suis]|uniref:DUF996 domain-containing protein n=1 Tax=Campylobacter suis TaxID=2790657 RepID=A0ABN7K3R4_9BACT|nr:hypothetical protein [Campylobacter suis]CAD7287164.1 hypothetical protein LMG8286_00795 [Campylobacter suis]
MQSIKTNSSDKISRIKRLGVVGSALPLVFGALPYFGLIFIVAGYIFLLHAITEISELSKDHKLRISYLISIFGTAISLALIVLGLFLAGIFSDKLIYGVSCASISPQNATGITIAAVGVCLLAVATFKYFKVFKKISLISCEPLFFYHTCFYVAGIIMLAFGIGIFILIISFIIQILAWIRLKDIR